MESEPILDKEQQKDVSNIVSVGGTVDLAAAYLGCSTYAICHTAELDESFHSAILKSGATHEILLLELIRKACDKATNWRAAVWILERLHPDRYGKRRPHTFSPTQVGFVLERFVDALQRLMPEVTKRDDLLVVMNLAAEEAGVIEVTKARISIPRQPAPQEN